MGGTSRTPYTTLTIAKKMELIQDVDQKTKPKGELAKDYGIAKSSLSTILKNRRKIEAIYYRHEMHRSSQRLKPAKNRGLESNLFHCISHMQQKQGRKITGSVLKEKALVLANMMNICNFRASNGWLRRFKKRYNISMHDMYDQDIALINTIGQTNPDDMLLSENEDDDEDGITLLVVNSEENEPKEPEIDTSDESESDKRTILSAIKTVQNYLSELDELPKNIEYSFKELKNYILDKYRT